MPGHELRVLLVEDDEEDYLITRDLLLEIPHESFHLDWAGSYEAGQQAIERNSHDLYLFDYHLGQGDGLALLGQAKAHGCKAPVILLTGLDDWETDAQAIKAGAADYLVKGQFDSKQLQRSIRHAMERRRAKGGPAESADEIQRALEQLKKAETLAYTDPLTGLGNRRRSEEVMGKAIAAARPFSLLVFDLNGFKAINDRYGHNLGDQLLKAVAQRVSNSVRGADVVCRWGGDELVIIMQNTAFVDAEARARQIQVRAFGEFILTHNCQTIVVNVSAGMGAAEYQSGETITECFERADQLLLENKRQVSALGHPNQARTARSSGSQRSSV